MARSRSGTKRERPGPARPQACLRVGRGNDFVGVESEEVCLSSTQARRLRVGEKIACGSFACAYEREGQPRDVVKLTQDATDVATMQALGRQQHLVKMRRAYQLRQPGTRGGVPIYAMIMERLEPLDEELEGMVQAISPAGDFGNAFDDSPDAGTRSYRVDESVRDMLHARCEAEEIADPHACRHLADGMIALHEKAGRKGVRLTDLHEGNIGVDPDTGEWKVLDVGYSRSGKPAVPTLAGFRAAWRRLRLR